MWSCALLCRASCAFRATSCQSDAGIELRLSSETSLSMQTAAIHAENCFTDLGHFAFGAGRTSWSAGEYAAHLHPATTNLDSNSLSGAGQLTAGGCAGKSLLNQMPSTCLFAAAFEVVIAKLSLNSDRISLGFAAEPVAELRSSFTVST